MLFLNYPTSNTIQPYSSTLLPYPHSHSTSLPYFLHLNNNNLHSSLLHIIQHLHSFFFFYSTLRFHSFIIHSLLLSYQILSLLPLLCLQSSPLPFVLLFFFTFHSHSTNHTFTHSLPFYLQNLLIFIFSLL